MFMRELLGKEAEECGGIRLVRNKFRITRRAAVAWA
jgi:hypothetical protein